ncbi:MAG: NADPH:quinone oxidoreductase family protein [Cypionkella sp.]
MQAWQVSALGVAAQRVDLPRPEPQAGEALVRIEACGLNFADLLMGQGKYQERPALPYIPGMEFSGVIEALGTEGHCPTPGSRVAGFAGSGGLAEYVCLPAARLVVLPAAMSFAEAAAFQIAYGTSHLALEHRAHLAAGETLLVLGAAGGVGLTAVEIGKRIGARVVACARGAARLAVAEAAGADVLIDSDSANLKAELKALGGVDVVYDAVGGAGFHAALSACRPEARILVIGFASGEVPQIPANLLLVKNLSVIGLYWGGYLNFAPEVLATSLRTLFNWYETGGLRPHISHQLAFEQYPQGLDLLKNRKATGKVVILRP